MRTKRRWRWQRLVKRAWTKVGRLRAPRAAIRRQLGHDATFPPPGERRCHHRFRAPPLGGADSCGCRTAFVRDSPTKTTQRKDYDDRGHQVVRARGRVAPSGGVLDVQKYHCRRHPLRQDCTKEHLRNKVGSTAREISKNRHNTA